MLRIFDSPVKEESFHAALKKYILQLVQSQGKLIEDPATLIKHDAYAILRDKIHIDILKPSDKPTEGRTPITNVGVFSGGIPQ